jgi:hypothetical protein
VAAVRKACDGKHPDIEAKALEEGWDATRAELEVLRTERPKVLSVITVGGYAPERKVLLATAAFAAKIPEKAMLASYGEQALDRAHKMRGMGMKDFLRLCAALDGRDLPLFSGQGTEFIQAAFSTMSVPGILADVANKALLEGYNYVEQAWRSICAIASVNDFKVHNRYRLTGDLKFQKVGADGELKHGTLGDQSFTSQADTQGILFALTRKDVINDDMGAFMALPRMIGMAGGETVNHEVWTTLLANPGSFFVAGHANYAAGAGTALSVTSLTQAEQAFLDQTKPNGRPLGVAPKILLLPTALKTLGTILMQSLKLNEAATSGSPAAQDNPHAGKFTPVCSAYLGSASYTGNSQKAWYLFADPNMLPVIEVAFLNGVQEPTVESAQATLDRLGLDFRGYLDFGVALQDWRGAVKMKGEA